MSGWEITGICAGVALVMIIIQKIAGAKTPVRATVLSMISGIAALIAVNLCAGFTDVFIPVSVLSLAVSAVLGIPGVTTLLILQMIL